MLLANGSAPRLQRRALWLLLIAGMLCFTAFLLSFQLPDIEEFKIGQEFNLARPGALRQLLVDDELEMYTLESAPFVNESVAEGRKRLKKVAIRSDFIFISISSYRDENCIATLTQIFTKCRHCDRVRVGLVDQLTDDDPPCQLSADLHHRFQSQIRTIRLDSHQARGPTFARYLSSRLWRGEQYLLQIDAHLNFISEWDRRLLDMVPRMPNAKFVISHYPVATVGELETSGNAVPFICTAKFDDYMKGLFSQDSGWYQINDHEGRPQASPFIGAGFLFGPFTILIDVPYDRYLDFLFHGEEFAHSARLWTSGYELVVPLENIVSHVYGHRKNNAFVDNPESSLLAEYARDRVRYMLGMSDLNPSRMEEIDDLGLGHVRTFYQYLLYTGLDLEKHQINSHCNDLYDWDTEQWYGANDAKPTKFQQLVTSLERFAPATESVQEFIERVRIQQMPGKIAPKTIFVSMSSYRDGWCESTLHEVFTKCRDCSRVFVGLVDQTLSGSDDRPCLGPEAFRSQIRLIRLDAGLAQGPTMARHLASKLYRNEQFYLQIDSHLKFMNGWDVELLDEIAQVPTTRAIFSTYPVIDTTDLTDPNMWVPWICDASFSSGLLIQAANSWYNRFNRDVISSNAVPGSSTFIAAGFLFAPAQILVDMPFDRHLPFLFHGEELLMAGRLWTKGWDFFIPLRNVVSHLYYQRNHTVYADRSDSFQIKLKSEHRARYILGLEPTRPEFDQDLDVLGLGTERSINDYWRFVGVDWTTQAISNRCQQIYDYIQKKWLPRPAD